jgi:ABC-2 type transport system permease protein
VALYTPPHPQAMPQLGIPGGNGPSFELLQQKLQENTLVDAVDLKDGRVPERADILKVEDTMVLDTQNAPLPIPTERDVGGGIKVRQIRLMDYPFFADVRGDGLARGTAPSSGMQQLTLSWASPLHIDANQTDKRRVVRLIESSPHSWAAKVSSVVPDFAAHPGLPRGEKDGRQLLGAMMEGEFVSFFAGKPSPLAKDAIKTKSAGEGDAAPTTKPATADKDTKPSITSVIGRSPESARLILIGSGNVLEPSSVDRTQYLAPVDFAQNLVDWSLEDRALLALRSRGGQFSRTLVPMEAGGRCSGSI